MDNIQRILHMDLPARQSAFLWGPRKTGKTTYLKARYPKSLFYDFLQTDLFLEFSKKPALLREQLLAKNEDVLKYPVILDEVQKVPFIPGDDPVQSPPVAVDDLLHSGEISL